MSIVRRGITLAGILVLGAIHGQVVTIDVVRNFRHSFYDRSTDKVIRIYDNEYSISDPDSTETRLIASPGIGDYLTGYHYLMLRGYLTMVSRNSGPVYQVNEGSVVRIDKSLDHQFQNFPADIIRNDTLYRHGGYGFWEAQHILSYFSEGTNQWEIVRPLTGEVPPKLFRHHSVVSDDEVYLFGGYTINPFNRMEQLPNPDTWKFDFQKREWANLGRTNPMVFQSTTYVQFGGTDGPSLILIADNSLTLLNVAANTLEQYPIPEGLLSSLNHVYPFVHRDHIHYYREITPKKPSENVLLAQKFEYLQIPLPHKNNKPVKTSTFYDPTNAYGWLWFLLIPIAGGIYYFSKTQRKSSSNPNPIATVTEDGIIFLGKHYVLAAPGPAILNLLMEQTEDVPSAEILERVAKPDLDYPSRTRIKNQAIRALNLELRSILRSDVDLIQPTESAFDKRIKCYRINKSRFRLLEKKYP